MTEAAKGVIVLYTTWPDRESVERAAGRLLEDRLIACANILGESRSIYRWEGEVQSEREIIAQVVKNHLGFIDSKNQGAAA